MQVCPVFQRSQRKTVQICKFVYLWVRRLLAYSHLSAVSLPTASLLGSMLVRIYLLCSGLGFIASLTAGFNIVPITEKSPWCLVTARKGTLPVTMVTSVPWERERDITVVAVFAASPAYGVQYPILIWLSRASHLYCLELVIFACFATIGQSVDWREPIGLQERLKGRSSHNGEISVMSRSRSQGTEVTIVTGSVFYVHRRPISLKYCSQICLNLC